jgi:hypothetical protein
MAASGIKLTVSPKRQFGGFRRQKGAFNFATLIFLVSVFSVIVDLDAIGMADPPGFPCRFYQPFFLQPRHVDLDKCASA